MAQPIAAAAGASLAAMLVLDVPWVTANSYWGVYKNRINGSVTSKPAVGALWVAVLIVNSILVGYLAYTAPKWWVAMLICAFAGLAVYGTFNATAVVLFKTWPGITSVADTAWGVFLFAVAGAAAFFAARAVVRTMASRSAKKKLDAAD